MAQPADLSTRQQILTVAQAHFAQHGFHAVSLRALTREAQVNVAAIHYHFGSKEALFLQVLKDCIAPFVALMTRHLDEAEPTAHSLVQDFAQACVAYARQDERQAVVTTRLLSRLMMEDYRSFRLAIAAEYRDLAQLYGEAFAQALPHLSPDVLRWRMHLALSTLFNAFAGNDILKVLAPQTGVNARQPEVVAEYVVPFVVQALSAP